MNLKKWKCILFHWNNHSPKDDGVYCSKCQTTFTASQAYIDKLKKEELKGLIEDSRRREQAGEKWEEYTGDGQ
jgi:hypothetical protein